MNRVDQMNVKELIANLTSAESFLRNRRMFAEADSVKFAKEFIIEETYNYVTRMEDDGK